MRVSRHYRLGRGQPELDFVDVDVSTDTAVFIDPTALRHQRDPWSMECVSLLQSFFDTVLEDLRAGRTDRAERLLYQLAEPNETRLGLSRGRPQGHGVGSDSAHRLAVALGTSTAATTGLLEDLEDTVLLIPGIGNDIVSDIITNIIRDPLIRYTQSRCRFYGMELQPNVSSGAVWTQARRWEYRLEELPVAAGRPLLLVPKVIVRHRLTFNANDYWSNYLVPYLRGVELDAGSGLVYLLKSGERRVRVRDLEQKYGKSKPAIAALTAQHPELLQRYREAKRERPLPPMEHEELEDGFTLNADLNALLAAVRAVPAGSEGATAYHRAIQDLLTALFYPDLVYPQREREIHEGRKRIDIVYSNAAEHGFFYWLSTNYTCPLMLIECKNFNEDPHNPELDQLSGRFSPNRGRIGLLVCRRIEDRETFERRCRDTVNDDRGFIVGLDDRDLAALVSLRVQGDRAGLSRYLTELFGKLL